MWRIEPKGGIGHGEDFDVTNGRTLFVAVCEEDAEWLKNQLNKMEINSFVLALTNAELFDRIDLRGEHDFEYVEFGYFEESGYSWTARRTNGKIENSKEFIDTHKNSILDFFTENNLTGLLRYSII